jgi:hypothetical protein
VTEDRASATRTARASATARCLLVWWALLFALYLVLIQAVSPDELGLGAGAALLGAAGAEAVRRAERPRVGGLRALAPAAAAFPPTLVQESARLAAEVYRELRRARHGGRRREAGSTVRLALDPGTSAAAAAVLLSASPGACVIDVEQGRGQGRDTGRGAVMTMHLLDRARSPVERALPGGRLR